ncbi:unnamed protein product [Haemonchus placei]|uniref:Glucosidase 2 subunit beta n=1 Tax=Haemonchus placei TaxID=6290 RepID=A0A158QLZ7_HAEPC|nr:unnamed protein product [Haemonchus placei]
MLNSKTLSFVSNKFYETLFFWYYIEIIVICSEAALYKRSFEFMCLDGSKSIPYDSVNDDYCDCDDGSDEPGTSACPDAKFHCVNKGHIAKDIPSSRVDDTICDCCDGSDELYSKVECPNICEELGRKTREESKKQAEIARKGFAARKVLAMEGQKLRDEKVQAAAPLKEEREKLLPTREELLKKKNTAVERESALKDKHKEAWEGKFSVLAGSNQVKTTVLCFLWSHSFQHFFTLVLMNLEAEAARKEYDELDVKITTLDSQIQEAEWFINQDFGSDLAWATLKGQCYELNDKQYTYKYCPFDKTVQKDSNGYGETALGNWKDWSGEPENKYSKQAYTGGQQCWNGPQRFTQVTIQCGETSELIEVTEPSKCEYRFLFRTPAACTDPDHEEQPHMEL